MDIVNRGKKNAAVAGPRPLHGYTYRFAIQPLATTGRAASLSDAAPRTPPCRLQGHRASQGLLFDGFDKLTRELNDKALTDIETATLLHFLSQRKDTADTRAGGDRFAQYALARPI
jgi:hypothetical protein